MQLKKISLGRGITNMSLYVGRVRTKRSRKPNPVISIEERVSYFRELVAKCGKLTRYGIQKHFGWGDGIMNSVHNIIKSVYDDEISWNSKKQEYIWIANQKEQQKLEEVSE